MVHTHEIIGSNPVPATAAPLPEGIFSIGIRDVGERHLGL